MVATMVAIVFYLMYKRKKMYCLVLSEGDKKCKVNEINGIENEWIVGKWIMLFGNPSDQKFWMQLQFQFKKLPKGILYMGGECHLNQSLWTNTLAEAIMKVAKVFTKNLVYGDFGTDCWRAVFPMYQGVDGFVESSGKEKVPILGRRLKENARDLKIRKMSKLGKKTWKMDVVYTMEFFTEYVDLEKWQMRGLPGFRNVALNVLVKELPINIVMYEVQSKGGKHPHRGVVPKVGDYLLQLKVEYVRQVEWKDMEDNGDSTKDVQVVEDRVRRDVVKEDLENVQIKVPMVMERADMETKKRKFVYVFAMKKRNVEYVAIRRPQVVLEMLAKGDMLVNEMYELAAKCKLHVVERQRHQMDRIFRNGIDKLDKNELCQFMNHTSMEDALFLPACHDGAKSIGVHMCYTETRNNRILYESEVYRVHWASYLQNEWAMVTAKYVAFYKSFSRLPILKIHLKDVLHVQAANTDFNAPGLLFVQIETLARVVFFSVANEKQQNSWVKVIRSKLDQEKLNLVLHSPLADAITQMDPSIAKMYATPSPQYATSQNRIVLNDKWMGQKCTPNILEKCLKPCSFSSILLQCALRLKMKECTAADLRHFLDQASGLQHIDIDSIASSNDRIKCFFLNVYHAMVIHAMLMLGLPQSKRHWSKFQLAVTYKIGNLIFSLAEIEHCIFRHAIPYSHKKVPHMMDLPQQFCRTDPRYRLVLTSSDFRLVFAALSGGKWNHRQVIIYEENTLNVQLNTACTLSLEYGQFRGDLTKRTVYLPKMIEWYQKDINEGSIVFVTRILWGFMNSHAHFDSIGTLVNSSNLVHFKFESADYTSHRYFRAYEDQVESDSDTCASDTENILLDEDSSPEYGLRIVDLNTKASPSPIILPNTEQSVDFENDMFVGKLLFLLKTPDMPSKWSPLFAGRRRLFWVQMQGKFKIMPSGPVYMGGEICEEMTLGVISRTFCKLLLRAIKSLVHGIHFSFGKLSTSGMVEFPHIVFPLHSAVDQFKVTKMGDAPPTLGQEDFGETPNERAERREAGDYFKYNTQDTYSFQFHSYFIDFYHWQVVNVPGMPEMNLKSFWRNLPLRLVAYQDKRNAKHHYQSENAYYFEFQLEHSSNINV